MPDKDGNKTGGRQKGSLNKHTYAFKDLIMNAYAALEKDPKFGIVKWAKENQTEFYKIAAKLIPIQVTANVNQVKQIIFTPSNGATKSNGHRPVSKKRTKQVTDGNK